MAGERQWDNRQRSSCRKTGSFGTTEPFTQGFNFSVPSLSAYKVGTVVTISHYKFQWGAVSMQIWLPSPLTSTPHPKTQRPWLEFLPYVCTLGGSCGLPSPRPPAGFSCAGAPLGLDAARQYGIDEVSRAWPSEVRPGVPTAGLLRLYPYLSLFTDHLLSLFIKRLSLPQASVPLHEKLK